MLVKNYSRICSAAGYVLLVKNFSEYLSCQPRKLLLALENDLLNIQMKTSAYAENYVLSQILTG